MSADSALAMRRPPGAAGWLEEREAGALGVLAQAHHLIQAGRLAEAHGLLWQAGAERSVPAGLRGRFELHRLWALARVEIGLGLFSQAAAHLAQLAQRDPAGLLGLRARATRADALFMAGDGSGAARAYQSLLRRFSAYPSPGRWLLGQAEGLLLAGRERAARSVLRRLWLEHPGGPDGVQADRLLALLPRDDEALPGLEALLGRVRRLGRAGRLEAARVELGHLVAQGRLSVARARLEQARLMLATYRYPEAVALLQALVRQGTPKIRAMARRLLPGALLRAGFLAAYLKHSEVQGKPRVPGWRARAGRREALLALGRYEEAARLVEAGGPAERTAFRAAYLWYRAGKARQAAQRLEAVLRRRPGHRAAAYWLAVIRWEQGRPEGRAALWRLATGPRLDWYALCARARLGAGVKEPAPRPVSPWPRGRPGPDAWSALAEALVRRGRSLAAHPHGAWQRTLGTHLEMAGRLLRVALVAAAQWELREAARLYLLFGVGGSRGARLRPLSAAEAWLGVRHRAGVRRLPGGGPAGGRHGRSTPPGGRTLPRLETLLYRVFRTLGEPYLANRFASSRRGRQVLRTPKAYPEAVVPAAHRLGLLPGRIWAVMAVESAFSPFVVSSAGALGLLQIMPVTAARIARALSRPDLRRADLFSPVDNVALGGWYLAALLRRFSDQFALAAAAYNAGPWRVHTWQAHRKGPQAVDVFVEEIPLQETRRYVKRVVARAAQYAVVLGEPYQDLLDRSLRPPRSGGIDF